MKKYFILGNGNTNHLLKWIKELKKYYDVYLITFEDVKIEVLQELEEEKVFIFNKHRTSILLKKLRIFLYLWQIKKIFDKFKPDIINAHYVSSYGFIASLAKNKNSVFIASAWGSDVLVFSDKSFFHKKILCYVLDKANFLTTDAHVVADKIVGLNKDNKSKIYTFSFFNVSEFLSDFEFVEKERVVFSNRGLYQNYNIDEIIKWFAKQDKSYSLIVAARGVEDGNLRQLVDKLNLNDRVKFVGMLTQSDQKAIYAKAMYYISIPTSDATSVSLLEAMSAGCIPIVSNIPANREWIINNYNGYYFSRGFNLPNQYSYEKAKHNSEIIFSSLNFSQAIFKLVSDIETLYFNDKCRKNADIYDDL